MAGAEQRRDRRFMLHLPVRVTFGRTQLKLTTDDIAFRGIFLRTDSPPVLRQLVSLQIDIAPGETFSCHGMAVHVVTPNDAAQRPPGVGIQFYALDESARKRWNAFVEQLQRSSLRGSSNDDVQADEPIRRRAVRRAAKFLVRVKTEHDLHIFTTRDVSRSGMFLRTTEPFEPGTLLLLSVSHGSSEPLTFEGIVRRRAMQGETPGIGVELTRADPADLSALLAAPDDVASEPLEFVTEYDPGLE